MTRNETNKTKNGKHFFGFREVPYCSFPFPICIEKRSRGIGCEDGGGDSGRPLFPIRLFLAFMFSLSIVSSLSWCPHLDDPPRPVHHLLISSDCVDVAMISPEAATDRLKRPQNAGLTKLVFLFHFLPPFFFFCFKNSCPFFFGEDGGFITS